MLLDKSCKSMKRGQFSNRFIAYVNRYNRFNKYLNYINQLHAVSRTHHGRRREPSVKTLRSPLSLRVEWRNSTPRFASTPERTNKNINVNKYFTSSSGYRTHSQSILQPCYILCPCATTGINNIFVNILIVLRYIFALL